MATEKRLIDATDENIKAILEKVPYYPDEIWKFTAMTKRFPAVDAVEVVRCKDCERRIEKRWCYSLHTYNGEPVGVADDFFCAYGKRKSDG